MDHNTILAALMLRNRDSGTSGLPSGSSPNQYLVTDGEGNAKWEDKPCWSEGERVVFAEEQSLQFQRGEAAVDFSELFSAGDTVRVVWEGVEYSFAAFLFQQVACVGNKAFVDGEDTGEPFFIACPDGQMMAMCQSETATFSCEGVKQIYHTINENLLPVATENNYGTVMFDVNKGAARYFKTFFNATYEEVLEAYEAFRDGCAVWCIAGDPVLSAFGAMDNGDEGMVCNLSRGGEDIVRIRGNPTDGITYMEREYSAAINLKSPSGQVWRITVSDDGTLTASV